jgi:hypothetical protein
VKPTRSIPILLIASACGAQPAQEPIMRVLIDNELNQRLAEVIGIDTHTITIRGIEGDEFVIAKHDLVAMTPATQWHSPSSDPTKQTRGSVTTRLGSLLLTDGQRLTGAPSVVGVDDELVAWSQPRLGIVSVPIEHVRHISMPRSMASGKLPAPLTPDIDDVILLTNGDTLRGFVETIGIETAIELATGSLIEAETMRIDQILLANEPANAAGTHIWLADGSVLAVSGLETEYAQDTPLVLGLLQDQPVTSALASRDPSEADATPFGLAFSFKLSELQAVSFDSQLLVPISKLAAESSGREVIVDTRGFASLGCANIHMPGPMRSTWRLPQGAQHLALTATLPRKARAWGNLIFVVRTDGNEISRHAINADSPVVRLNLDISGAQTFSLEITEGEFGPVQDRLVLSQGLVLIGD